MTGSDDAAAMARGIRAIKAYEARLRRHNELGNGAPPPPEIAERLGHPEQLLAQTVRCPYCKALPDSPCHLANGRLMEARFHPGRLDNARAAQAKAAAQQPSTTGEPR